MVFRHLDQTNYTLLTDTLLVRKQFGLAHDVREVIDFCMHSTRQGLGVFCFLFGDAAVNANFQWRDR